MNMAFYTGVSGMVSYQKGIDNIANNMANVQTPGFKVQRASFEDALRTQLDVKSNKDELTGHGVKHTKNDLIYTQGSLQYTNRTLDFAIEGDGFFKLEEPNGEYSYTRAGNFNISVEGGRDYLISNDGSYVLDTRGQKIEVPKSKSDSSNGSNVLDYSGVAEKIGVYTFDNPFELMPVGDLKLKQTDLSGENKIVGKDSGYKLIQGAYENSTTDVASEMTHLIETQKAYQFSAKIVQTSDQIEEIVNTLR